MATRGVKPQTRAKPSGRPWNAHFTDISREAGLTAPTLYGGIDRIDYLLETSSGGVAFLDYDSDGFPDLFLVAQDTNRLYRNNRDGTFTEVTDKAGLRRSGWASGAAAGDYDGDGHDDLLVTYYGQNALYRNKGSGAFTDVTAQAGLLAKETRWNSGATFLDYDRDGDLDLFIANYIALDLARTPKPGANSFCNWKGIPVACGPRGLPPSRGFLYRNDKGAFTDVSEEAGIAAAQRTYGMTAAAADFDDDGFPDIYLASDSTPSLLFRNLRNGKFAEEGLERGVALNEDGREQAGMGLGIGDFNLDGRLDIFKTHFADDTHTLYQSEGKGQFRDVTLAAGLAVETRYVGWGTAIADFDNDGLPDIFLVTGNVYPEIEKDLPAYPYKTPRLLFRNLGPAANGNIRFEQILGEPAVDASHSSRGMAVADIDRDGDLDILIWNRNEPPSLLRNDLTSPNHWIQVAAPLGTRVTATYGARKQTQEVLSQCSFYSVNERVLHFGLGASATADLAIRWPDGSQRTLRAVAANRLISPGGGRLP